MTNPNFNKNELSDTKENFKLENLRLLSKNALPPYTPGSPPAFFSLNQAFERYHCTDCGDTFTCKSSAKFHLERRSVLIKFPCDTCKTICIFYNRCNLFSHIRNHKNKNETAVLGKAVMTVIPLELLMKEVKNDFVSNLDDELNSLVSDLAQKQLLECLPQEVNVTLPSNEPSKTENAKIVEMKCFDCNEEFDIAKQRAEHLTNRDKMPVVASHCDKCGILCPSQCCLKAHQRIHLQTSRKCEENPDRPGANFLHRMNLKCLHKAHSVAYKCPTCKDNLPDDESLLERVELHDEKFDKCCKYSRAFYSSPVLKSHNIMYHDDEEVGCTVVYNCSFCDSSFVSRAQMTSHMSTHIKDKTCEYVFDCELCRKPIECKEKSVEHINRGIAKCLLSGSIFPSYQDCSSHDNTFHQSNLPHRNKRITSVNIKAQLNKKIQEAILSGKEKGFQVKVFPDKGRGVITIKPFKQGEFVLEYHGELIDYEEAKRREMSYSDERNLGSFMYYFKFKNKQYCIDATKETNRLGRLINHNRKGNLKPRLFLIEDFPHLVFFAGRDIEPLEELNYDYGDRSKSSLAAHPWLAL